MEQLKILSKDEERLLSYEELIRYYEQLREYYKNLPIDSKNISLKEKIHPALLNLVKFIYGNNITIINKENLPTKDEACIYVCNHSNGYDFPTAAAVIKNHFHILADFTMQKDKIVDTLNRINGVIYINRHDKQSRKNSKTIMNQLALNNKNLFVFPEGTWNLTPSTPMLELNWGIIDIARISNLPIIPIIIEYKEKKKIVNIGKPIYIGITDSNEEKKDELRDVMATLRWEVWEQFPLEKRSDIPDEYYNNWLKNTLKTYSKFDLEYESSVILKKYSTPEEVFEPIKKLQITKKNAFLLNERKLH